MTANRSRKRPITLLKNSLATLFSNPSIIFPFICIAFTQLFIFEILLFSTRHPLNVFFGPIIQRIEGNIFLHYPFNYLVIMKWWQDAIVQSTVYVFISSLFLGMAVATIEAINNNRKINYGTLIRKSMKSYVHLFCASSLTVFSMFLLSSVHGMIIGRATEIRSTAGIFFIIKQAVLMSAPYVNLLLAIIVTTLFIFLIPIIIIDGKKITAGILINFRVLFRSLGVTLGVVFLSAMIYVPVILLKTFSALFQKQIIPELWPLIPLFSILLSLFIDAIQYTAITTYYLLTKEEK